MKILCFGDSITYGESDVLAGGWADRLKNHFLVKYADSITQEISVYNLGIGGETTDGLRQRFEIELNARHIKGQRLVVIFSYGSNDIVIHKNKNIVPPEYFIRNLRECIEKVKKKGGEVILSSLTPIADTIDGVINQHRQLRYKKDIEYYNLILKKLSNEVNATHLDIYNDLKCNKTPDLLSSDGVHPSSSGHNLINLKVKSLISETVFHD